MASLLSCHSVKYLLVYLLIVVLPCVTTESSAEWGQRMRNIRRIASPPNVERCHCRSWQDSPLMAAVRNAWDRRMPVSGSGNKYKIWLESITFLGSTNADRSNHCIGLATDMWEPDTAMTALNLFGERVLGDKLSLVRLRSQCLPLMAAVAIICGLRLYSDLDSKMFVRDDVSGPAISINSATVADHEMINVADTMMLNGARLVFQCGASPPGALGLVSTIEARWNIRRYVDRFRTEAMHLFLWHHMSPKFEVTLAEALCPSDMAQPLSTSPSVECLIPATWPEDYLLMEEIADTWARDCDICTFFVALRTGVSEAPAWIGNCSVSNIANGTMVDDPKSYTTSAAKLQTVFLQGIQNQTLDWVCFADTDLYFVVPNFRRLAVRRKLKPGGIHWMGFTYTSLMLVEGLSVEPFGGSCLSRGASQRFRDNFKGFDEERNVEVASMLWPPTLHPCKRMTVPHKPGYTMSVATSCLRRAGIFPMGPHLSHDDRGRLLYFNFNQMQPGLLRDLRPPHSPFRLTELKDKNDSLHNWKGKEYIYSACRNTRWAGYYPVVFHGHITHAPGFFEPFKGTHKESKKELMRQIPSQRELHLLLSSRDWLLPDNLKQAFEEVFKTTRLMMHPHRWD